MSSTSFAKNEQNESPVSKPQTPFSRVEAPKQCPRNFQKMTSFDRRVKKRFEYKNPDAKGNVPSLYRQTVTSLMKRNSGKGIKVQFDEKRDTHATDNHRDDKNGQHRMKHHRRHSEPSPKMKHHRELSTISTEEDDDIQSPRMKVEVTDVDGRDDETEISTPSPLSCVPRAGSSFEAGAIDWIISEFVQSCFLHVIEEIEQEQDSLHEVQRMSDEDGGHSEVMSSDCEISSIYCEGFDGNEDTAEFDLNTFQAYSTISQHQQQLATESISGSENHLPQFDLNFGEGSVDEDLGEYPSVCTFVSNSLDSLRVDRGQQSIALEATELSSHKLDDILSIINEEDFEEDSSICSWSSDTQLDTPYEDFGSPSVREVPGLGGHDIMNAANGENHAAWDQGEQHLEGQDAIDTQDTRVPNGLKDGHRIGNCGLFRSLTSNMLTGLVASALVAVGSVPLGGGLMHHAKSASMFEGSTDFESRFDQDDMFFEPKTM